MLEAFTINGIANMAAFSNIVCSFDRTIISTLKRVSPPLARVALFIVFFWFGILKVMGQSPANPLIAELLEQTLPGITFGTFIIFFGYFEMLIGILFLVPRAERVAIALLLPHMVTTVLPLILLPSITWIHPFVPTLEGQYIIKNVVIVALALGIAAHLRPWSRVRRSNEV